MNFYAPVSIPWRVFTHYFCEMYLPYHRVCARDQAVQFGFQTICGILLYLFKLGCVGQDFIHLLYVFLSVHNNVDGRLVGSFDDNSFIISKFFSSLKQFS